MVILGYHLLLANKLNTSQNWKPFCCDFPQSLFLNTICTPPIRFEIIFIYSDSFGFFLHRCSTLTIIIFWFLGYSGKYSEKEKSDINHLIKIKINRVIHFRMWDSKYSLRKQTYKYWSLKFKKYNDLQFGSKANLIYILALIFT